MSATLLFQHMKITVMLLSVHATVVSGKTYYMLKVLEKKGDKRPIQMITRTIIQYPNY